MLALESVMNIILRYWLEGPKAGEIDVFAGAQNNIRRNLNGEY